MKSKLMITHGTVTHPEGAECKYCEGVKDEAEPYIQGFLDGKEETLRDVGEMIAGELLKMQIEVDANRGDGTGNERLTMIEYGELFERIIDKLKPKEVKNEAINQTSFSSYIYNRLQLCFQMGSRYAVRAVRE